jgi:hypothetical protein
MVAAVVMVVRVRHHIVHMPRSCRVCRFSAHAHVCILSAQGLSTMCMHVQVATVQELAHHAPALGEGQETPQPQRLRRCAVGEVNGSDNMRMGIGISIVYGADRCGLAGSPPPPHTNITTTTTTCHADDGTTPPPPQYHNTKTIG